VGCLGVIDFRCRDRDITYVLRFVPYGHEAVRLWVKNFAIIRGTKPVPVLISAITIGLLKLRNRFAILSHLFFSSLNISR